MPPPSAKPPTAAMKTTGLSSMRRISRWPAYTKRVPSATLRSRITAMSPPATKTRSTAERTMATRASRCSSSSSMIAVKARTISQSKALRLSGRLSVMKTAPGQAGSTVTMLMVDPSWGVRGTRRSSQTSGAAARGGVGRRYRLWNSGGRFSLKARTASA